MFVGWEPVAWADWPYMTEVVEKSGDVGPTAVAIRHWANIDRVYITVEMGDEASNEVGAELYRYRCIGGASCVPTLFALGTWPQPVGDWVGGPNFLHVAMAIREEAALVEVVDIIRRDKWDLDCDDDGITNPIFDPAEAALDLPNFDYRTDTNAVVGRDMVSSNVGVNTNNACRDSGASQLKNSPTDVLNACYTFKVDPLDGDLDRIRCNDDSVVVSDVWDNMVELTSDVVEDHPAFAFKEGDRVAVGSRRPPGPNNDTIRFHFPDDGAFPEPHFDLALDGDVVGGIYPDMTEQALNNGGDVVHAVWEAKGGTEIRYGRCRWFDTCESAADWNVNVPHSTPFGRVRYPEIAFDGNFQILVWEEDADDVEGGERIFAATRCVGAGVGWSPPEQIRTPQTVNESQSLHIGNPRLVLDKNDNVAHVVFLETGGTGAEIWWARKEYTDCP